MSIPHCPTHHKALEEDPEDSSKWICPKCGYSFYLTNPDIEWSNSEK